MRYAIVSDIHANLPAWNAVLADIGGLDIDHIINLGDIVGYGPSPSEVIASVKKHAAASVIGNHDAVCADRLDPSIFNENARAVIEWTKAQLNEEDSKFLKEMHEMIRPEGAGFLITHAEVASPFNFGYILNPEDAAKNFAACEDTLIFIGHTHFAGVFMEDENGEASTHKPVKFECEPGKRYIINPGSVGDPRTSEIVASYCVYDSETAKVEFRKVPFDIEHYRQLFSDTNLTSKPYFLRYLDDTSSGGKQMNFPTVEDSEILPPKTLATANINNTPAIDFRGTIAAGLSTPKKKSPLLPIILILSLSLIIGAGVITWKHINKTENPVEIAADSTITETPEVIKTAKAPQKTEETPPEKTPKIIVTMIAKKLPVTGRYVRISRPKGPYLAIAEVEIVSDEVNVAKGKSATQSSNYSPSMHAGKAVDGIRKGDNSDLLSHTRHQDPWWEVDLGQDYNIQKINIWNRNEGRKLMARLDKFTLQIFNEKREMIYQTHKNPGNRHIIKVR